MLINDDESRVRTIAEIDRLDGLPLAIELAAAPCLRLPIDQVVHGILGEAAASASTAPRIGEPISSTIERSYRLLDEGTQQVFRWISVFEGPVSLSAIEDVCSSHSGHAKLLHALSELVALSLLDFDPSDARYRLLNIVRAFAVRELQASGEQFDTSQALVDWAVALVKRLQAMPHAEQVQATAADYTNLVAALSFSSTSPALADQSVAILDGLHLSWQASGRIREALRWYTRVYETPSLDPEARATLAQRLASLHAQIGDDATMAELSEEAVESFVAPTTVSACEPCSAPRSSPGIAAPWNKPANWPTSSKRCPTYSASSLRWRNAAGCTDRQSPQRRLLTPPTH